MLKHLSVENYALIDKLDIAFAPGLNIITGETGAGKSILLGALGLVLGARADVAVLRNVERNCVIEAEFDLTGYGLELLFEEQELDYEAHSVVRRVITPAGKSRAYINDLPVQLTVLRGVGERLIDIHSQHQTLLVGDSRFQINLVDSVAQHGEGMERYRAVFERLAAAERELTTLKRKAESSSKDIEYITFQLEQLVETKLIAGEQEQLEARLGELTHASQIKEVLLFSALTMEEDESGVLQKLKSLELSLGRLQGVYSKAEELHERLRSTLLELKDWSTEVSAEGERVEADPAKLEQTQQRLDTLYMLQQKHKVASVDELIELQTAYQSQLDGIEGYAEEIKALTITIEQLHEQAETLAAEISERRRTAAPRVEGHVKEVLSELGMLAAQLQVEITPAEGLREDGADVIRFLFTANKNSALQPIEKVASGGEMSRLMLALKALVAKYTQLPTIIFDEIDTGVSGSVADKMGEIIVRLATDLQIVNITHLPQVASKGDHHFYVYKEESETATSTSMRKLTPAERVDEIAKMLSGTDVTSAAREQARLLLG